MPTYEYRCKSCEHEFEVFQGILEKTLRKCPQCGKRQLERLIGGGAAIIFRGSGFFQTDYRGSGAKKPEGDGKDAGTEDKTKTTEASKTASSPDD